jgi:thioredoxin 1
LWVLRRSFLGTGGYDGYVTHLLAIDSDNFIAEVIDATKPVLLDCWASWCAPCRKLAPELEALARQEPDRLIIAKLDCDEFPDLAHLLGVSILPTMLLFVDGVVESSLRGYRPKDEILEHVKPFLKTKKGSGAGG